MITEQSGSFPGGHGQDHPSYDRAPMSQPSPRDPSPMTSRVDDPYRRRRDQRVDEYPVTADEGAEHRTGRTRPGGDEVGDRGPDARRTGVEAGGERGSASRRPMSPDRLE